MRSTTGLDLLTRSFRTVQVLAAGETPSSDDAQAALDLLNSMIDGWGIQRYTQRFRRRVVYPITAGFQALTVGDGGDIDLTEPPMEIEQAGLILNNTLASNLQTEVPVEVMTDRKWADLRIKALSSPLIKAVYYDHNFDANQWATLYVYPVPSVSYTSLVLYLPQQIDQFADLSTAYVLPNGYEEAMVYNLAVRIAIEWGKRLPMDHPVVLMALKTLGDLKAANLRMIEVGVEDALLPEQSGRWNWMTNGR